MAISVVQSQVSRSHVSDGSIFNLTVTLSPTTAGNLLFVTMSYTRTPGGTQTVTDSDGNSYTLAVAHSRGGANDTAQVWYCENALGGGSNNVVTWNSTGQTFTDVTMVAGEASGVATSTSLDQTNTGEGTATTSPATSGVTTGAAGELVLAVLCYDLFGTSGTVNVTDDGAYTNLATDAYTNTEQCGGDHCYKVAGGAGTEAGNWTVNQAVYYSAVIATFKAAAGAADKTPWTWVPSLGPILAQ